MLLQLDGVPYVNRAQEKAFAAILQFCKVAVRKIDTIRSENLVK